MDQSEIVHALTTICTLQPLSNVSLSNSSNNKDAGTTQVDCVLKRIIDDVYNDEEEDEAIEEEDGVSLEDFLKGKMLLYKTLP
eukprot:15310326-Ditylum_brightwellii.AAC.1